MPPTAVNDTDAAPEVFFSHHPDTEPIAGYRLLEPLGCGGFGEVWKCEAPGGLLKAIKFVQGSQHALDANPPAEEELRAIQRVKAIRHPFILSMERVEVVQDELVIVLELADKNLADALRAEQLAGRVGISRESLLAYLRETAEALDVMNACHGLQHLDVKPQNLFLVSNHVKVGDFGLVNNFVSGRSTAPTLGAITPLYASPEVFQGTLSPHCDQYSLAIVYQQLLTGTLPFKGKNGRQLLMQHVQGQPDLHPLPAGDREVVARALSKSPGERFASCSDFVQALMAGLTEVVSSTIGTEPPGRFASPSAETRPNKGLKTVRVPPVSLRPPTLPADAPVMEIGDLITRTPLAEVWRARAADGFPRLVKVLFGCVGPDADGLARLSGISHPLLARVEVLDHTPGRLVLATVPGERTIRDLLLEYQGQGVPGIPRNHLLRCLQGVAEVLDFFAHQGLHHLGLNLRSLLLQDDRLFIGDFGLAQLVWLPSAKALASLNARYSAPELHRRQVTAACDQFSLALIYHELLTGAYPPGGPDKPDLRLLPESDRAVISRALHPNPLLRWCSALDMIAALKAASPPEETDYLAPCPVSAPDAANLAGGSSSPSFHGTNAPGDGGAPSKPSPVMQARFGSSLTADLLRKRLDGFCEQWRGEVYVSEPRRLVFHMQTPRNFWQRWTGKQPGLEIELEIGYPDAEAPEGVQTRTEVSMNLRPCDCTREQSSELFGALGPLLIESVRAHLRRSGYGRSQDRVIWHHPLQLCPIEPDGSLGAPIECQGKDISLNGIGFYLPGQLPSSLVRLHLPRTEQTQQMAVSARIVRVQGCGNGWYEVGAILLPPDEPPGEESRTDSSDAGAAQ
jgi:serine/threonine protein kinase